MIGIGVILVVIVLLFVYICTMCDCCEKRKAKLKKKFSVSSAINGLIGFTYFNWLKVCFGLGLTMRGLLFGEDFNLENSMGLAFIIIHAVLLPLLFIWIIKCKFDSLDEEPMRDRYGTIYNGLSLTRLRRDRNDEEKGYIHVQRKDIWVYPLVFLARRTIFIIISILLFDRPNV